MSQFPINPLTPEEQQKIMGQIYLLMGKQVDSYHKHRHMASNSSVTIELAQELMESIEYTVNQVGGMYAHSNVEKALELGQKELEKKIGQAQSLLELVCRTAPSWQTECRWDAVQYLRHYLEHYDHLHLAHQGPEELFYPILIVPPENTRGIDFCLFYLHILWIENQIMAAIPDAVLDDFWNHLAWGSLNQCEHLLINGMGKALLGSNIVPLLFDAEDYVRIKPILNYATEDGLKYAAMLLCKWLDLKDEKAKMYVNAVIPQLRMWTGSNANLAGIENLFL